mgnify:CR=1 FL=1
MEYEETLEDVLRLLFPRAHRKMLEVLLEISSSHACPSNYILRRLIDVGAVRVEAGGNRCLLSAELGLKLVRLGLVWLFFVLGKRVGNYLANLYIQLEKVVEDALRG